MPPITGQLQLGLTGPTETGHYLASYVVAGEDEFCGYAKVCLSRPRDLWNCQVVSKVGAPPASTASEALDNVELVARNVLRMQAQAYDNKWR